MLYNCIFHNIAEAEVRRSQVIFNIGKKTRKKNKYKLKSDCLSCQWCGPSFTYLKAITPSGQLFSKSNYKTPLVLDFASYF